MPLWLIGIATIITLAVCVAFGWAMGTYVWGFPYLSGFGLWCVFGIWSLRLYLDCWTDTPPLWFWPVIVLFWPIVWTGGIIHPLR